MKLDFSGMGGGAALPLPRRLIERRMRRLDVRPLDDAGHAIRTGLIAAALFFGLFLAFATLVPISGAAIATGEVSVSGNRLVIQPVSSGIVSQMLVHEGQLVRAGQPLVRLNGVRSGAQLKQAQARRDALRAQEARLLAERDGLDTLVFPPDLTRRGDDANVRSAMDAQRQLFAEHRSVLTADLGISDAQLMSARAKQVAVERQLALIQDELGDYRKLYQKGFARLTTIRSLERNEAELVASAATGRAEIAQAELSRRKTRDGQKLDTVSELKSVQDQLAQLDPQLDVTRYFADLDVMRAPVDGRVSNVAQVGPGTVVSGGRTLMEVVPNGRALLIEAQVKPGDIDQVHVGSEARVRFSTVNPHGLNAFEGKVITLSPTRIESQSGGYYRAQIAIENPERMQRAGVTLQPGIAATVNIQTQSRTLMGYLLQPFRDALSKSFKQQ